MPAQLPTPSAVELRDELQQPVRCGVDVRGKSRDLIAEAFEGVELGLSLGRVASRSGPTGIRGASFGPAPVRIRTRSILRPTLADYELTRMVGELTRMVGRVDHGCDAPGARLGTE